MLLGPVELFPRAHQLVGPQCVAVCVVIPPWVVGLGTEIPIGPLWWVAPSWQSRSLSPQSRMEERIGRTGTRELVGQDKDREITLQLSLWAKQTQFGQIYCELIQMCEY